MEPAGGVRQGWTKGGVAKLTRTQSPQDRQASGFPLRLPLQLPQPVFAHVLWCLEPPLYQQLEDGQNTLSHTTEK